MKIAILASTNGTNLPALFRANLTNAQFVCLISNKEDAGALKKAKDFNIPAYFISPHNLTREQYDQKIIDTLNNYNVDLIVLNGYMLILSSVFIQKYKNKIINVHPSLLPAFAGGMNKDVHAAVLERGCKVTGATVHYVTEELDGGPILAQKCVPADKNDTPETLGKKVQKVEQELLIEVIGEITEEF